MPQRKEREPFERRECPLRSAPYLTYRYLKFIDIVDHQLVQPGQRRRLLVECLDNRARASPRMVPLKASLRKVQPAQRRVLAQRIDQGRNLRFVEHVCARPINDGSLFKRVKWQTGTDVPQLPSLCGHGDARLARLLHDFDPRLEDSKRREGDR